MLIKKKTMKMKMMSFIKLGIDLIKSRNLKCLSLLNANNNKLLFNKKLKQQLFSRVRENLNGWIKLKIMDLKQKTITIILTASWISFLAMITKRKNYMVENLLLDLEVKERSLLGHGISNPLLLIVSMQISRFKLSKALITKSTILTSKLDLSLTISSQIIRRCLSKQSRWIAMFLSVNLILLFSLSNNQVLKLCNHQMPFNLQVYLLPIQVLKFCLTDSHTKSNLCFKLEETNHNETKTEKSL